MILLILTHLLRARYIEQHPVFLIAQVYIDTLRCVFVFNQRHLSLVHFSLQYYRLQQIGLLAVLFHLFQQIRAFFISQMLALFRARKATLECVRTTGK